MGFRSSPTCSEFCRVNMIDENQALLHVLRSTLLFIGIVSFCGNAYSAEYCKYRFNAGYGSSLELSSTDLEYVIPIKGDPNAVNLDSTLRNLIASAYFSKNKPSQVCEEYSNSSSSKTICTVTKTGFRYDPANNVWGGFPNANGEFVSIETRGSASIAPGVVDCSLANYSQPLYDDFSLTTMYQSGVQSPDYYLKATVRRRPIEVIPNAQKTRF